MSQDNQNSQPLWKAKIIQVLRGTIGVLETTVEKLETAPSPGTEKTPSLWSGFLAKIRSFLPANLSAKFSDTALTGIIASIAVILVWTTATVLTNKPVEVATVPPVEVIPTPTPTITTSPELPVVEPSPPVVETPPEPEPTPTPTPTLELTPEQTLIAAIENQVAEISDRFASGLIQSIQANFRTSNLTVKINDDWYTLKESQQNKLAAEILQRSQELDFTHLEILDSQDRLIARNPIVGNEMIVFKRQTS